MTARGAGISTRRFCTRAGSGNILVIPLLLITHAFPDGRLIAVGISSKEQHVVQLGARGRLVLPAPVRKALALEEGDRVVLTVRDDGSLRLASLKRKIQQFQGMFKDLEPDVDWSQELIEQRREEAWREEDR